MSGDVIGTVRSPRSWSLPAPPPDDVTVETRTEYRVYVESPGGNVYDDRFPDIEEARAQISEWHDRGWTGARIESALFTTSRSPWRPVVEGEPPAPEPQAAEPPTPSFAVGDRVRIKPTDDVGVVDEAFSHGANIRFVREAFPDVEQVGYFTDESLEPAPEPQAAEPPRFAIGARVRGKNTGRLGTVDASPERGSYPVWFDGARFREWIGYHALEPAPEPPRFERGFYRLARDPHDVDDSVLLEAETEIALMDGADHEWAVMLRSGSTLVLDESALAAAGAERVEEEQA